jgi:hypothetical protein
VAGTYDGTNIAIYIDSVSVAGATTTVGTVTSWSPLNAGIGSDGIFGGPEWSGSIGQVAFYNTALSAAKVANHYQLLAVPVESSDARIARALSNWTNVGAASILDAGLSQIQAPTSNMTTTSVLSHIQQVELSEDGALFTNTSGRLRFWSRASVLSATQLVGSVATFGDGVGEYPHEIGPNFALDTLDLYTSAQLQRNGGNTQTVGSGVRVYQQTGLLNTTDQEVLNYANRVVSLFGTAQERIRSITLHPFNDPTGGMTTAVLGLELLSIITVKRHNLPGAGTAFVHEAFVEGINHHIDPTTGDWTVDLQLTPAANAQIWVLGTSQLGVNNVLG